jgi:hypothetical protein
MAEADLGIAVRARSTLCPPRLPWAEPVCSMAEADLGIAVHAVLLTQPLLTSSMCKARLKAPAEPGVATVVRRLILRVLERLLVLLSAESLSASPSVRPYLFLNPKTPPLIRLVSYGPPPLHTLLKSRDN